MGCLVSVAYVALFYVGLLGIGFGLLGYIWPCNRYADASVTWCGPGLVLGSSVFNISYVDDDRRTHVGSIVDSWVQCIPSSTAQTVRVCYPLRDPGDFTTNGVVVFDDARSAPMCLLGGLACIAMVALGAVLEGRRQSGREAERPLLSDPILAEENF